MNKIESFALSTISSFLQPTELCRIRYLNRLFHSASNSYLKRKYNTVYLEDKACPKCGSFFLPEDLTDDTYFYDVLYGNVDSISANRLEMVNYILSRRNHSVVKRTSLLCDTCETQEIEDPTTCIQKFRYQGFRVYYLYVINNFLYPWAVLSTRKDDNILWNQYRCMIDPIIPYDENEYDEDMDEEEEDEDEDEDF